MDIDMEKLYEMYFMKLYSFVMTLAKNSDTAEEITQNTFFKAMQSKHTYKGQSDEFVWLCSIAKNMYIDEYRKRKRLFPFDEKNESHKHISSFQAFAVSVATRVGTGNLAGVATAIAVGGPGAVFWMWVIALIGAATAFVESTLGQLFKKRNKDHFIGGPAYYIEKGLHQKWMAYTFAILLTITFGLSYNSIQSNTICGAMHEAFGWSPLAVGVVIAALALLIVFGGIHRIANVSAVLVPLMAIGYFLLVVVVIIMNIHLIPHVLKAIITDAFGLRQGAGGMLGRR